MKKALTGLGKALVVIMGVGYGVATALDVFSPEPVLDDIAPKSPPATSEATPPPTPGYTEDPAPEVRPNQTAEALTHRFDGVEQRLARLEKSVEALTLPADHLSGRSEHFVTRAELSAAMERFAGTLDTDLQRRFDIQNRSVQSLRTMVARTDELLEQVLETIESVGTAA